MQLHLHLHLNGTWHGDNVAASGEKKRALQWKTSFLAVNRSNSVEMKDPCLCSKLVCINRTRERKRVDERMRPS